LSRIFLFSALLAIALAGGCKAQSGPAAGAAQTLDRRVELMVRRQYNVSPDFEFHMGARKASQIPGYDTLTVTFTRGENKTDLDFLISADSKTLARLESWDLVNDPVLKIDVAGRPTRGNPDARVTIVSYDDLACPYCARMHSTLFPATLDRYKGLLKVVYKDNPLSAIHPWALHAAVDANCLAAQSGEAYWTYVDYIHSHGQEVNGEDRNLAKSFDALNRIARQHGLLAHLDGARLDNCIAAQDDSKIRATEAEAEALHIEGAPALFVNGEAINGAVPESAVWKVIDRALLAQGIQPPAAEQPKAQAAQAQAAQAQAAPAK
jgi:protein-disulfide isomerase